jgi:hypothetical protein
VEIVRDGEKILGIIYRNCDWSPGLNFCTPGEMFIQAGCWVYPSGKKLPAHRHKFHQRTVTQTQEVAYVKRGRLKVLIYNDQKELMGTYELEAGEFAVLATGGHGYEILEDDTQILEVKNGPFIDVAVDKENL